MISSVAFLALSTFANAPIASSVIEDSQKLIDLSKRDNQVMAHITELCTTIGARPTGSPEYLRAQQWGVNKFKQFGLQNVHLEKWGDVPVGFSRGPNNFARLVEPFESEIHFTTNCWMPGTDGLKTGPVVLVPKNIEEFEKVKASLKGAWVLCYVGSGMRGAVNKEDKALTDAINGAGILGRINSAAEEYLHTHGSWKDKTFENRPKTVEINVRRSDYDRMMRNINFGRKTVAEFNVDNRWQKGPIEVSNVIAEIKGSEFPDEVVVVGGHLDSWNSPGSQGASDNGTGTSSTIEAARLLVKSGLKPRRTIRFMLFGGEEQGLLGSGGYVAKHLSEMPKITACIVDDGGSNYESGINGLAAWGPYFVPAFDLMTKNFPEMPMKFNAVEKYNASGGSDQASFWAKGVPSFFMGKTGKQVYRHIWHTQFDTLAEVHPQYLKQCSTSLAVLSYNIACADSMLPRQ